MKDVLFVIANDYCFAAACDERLPTWLRRCCEFVGVALEGVVFA